MKGYDLVLNKQFEVLELGQLYTILYEDGIVNRVSPDNIILEDVACSTVGMGAVAAPVAGAIPGVPGPATGGDIANPLINQRVVSFNQFIKRKKRKKK